MFCCICFSNASDALDKLRFLSVTDASLLGDAGELEIRIKPDPEKGTITISYESLIFLKLPWYDGIGILKNLFNFFFFFVEILVLE